MTNTLIVKSFSCRKGFSIFFDSFISTAISNKNNSFFGFQQIVCLLQRTNILIYSSFFSDVNLWLVFALSRIKWVIMYLPTSVISHTHKFIILCLCASLFLLRIHLPEFCFAFILLAKRLTLKSHWFITMNPIRTEMKLCKLNAIKCLFY